MMRRIVVLAALAAAGAWPGLAPTFAADQGREGDQKFVMEASAAGLAEVNLAKVATTQAHSKDVRKFARHILEDHSKANRTLLELADRKQFPLARQMDQTHREASQKLLQMTGADFDHAFIRQMVKDHEEAVSLFEDEAKNGHDKSLKAWAKKTLPTLKDHLKMARDLTGERKEKKER